jgi:flavodoxin
MKRIVLFCLAQLFLTTAFASDTNILVAYFSMPERAGTDAVAGASRVVSNSKVFGNTQWVAERIVEATGGDSFLIETVQSYPAEHDDLVDQGDAEKRRNARPTLSGKISNLDQYDVIFIGYPVWWADLPMPLYSFLESYDLRGKTIIPFSTHGGSGFADTIAAISGMEPRAKVLKNGLTVSRTAIMRSGDDIKAWVRGLNLD